MNVYERAADILSRLTTTNKYEKPISVLLRARPLLEAVEKAEPYADPETGLGFLRGEDEDAVLRAALAYRQVKEAKSTNEENR